MTNAKRKIKSDTAVNAKTTSPVIQLAPPMPDQPEAAKQESGSVSTVLGKGPFHKERLGRVHLAIWVREDKSGTIRFSVKLSRNYKTATGFGETSSLDQGDLANAITLLTQAQAILPPVQLAVVQEPQA
ncbi:MAG: hypothetical protein V4671_16055 [Armatimonadota bacterium]